LSVDAQGNPATDRVTGACFYFVRSEPESAGLYGCDGDDGALDGIVTLPAYTGDYQLSGVSPPMGFEFAGLPVNLTVSEGGPNSVTVVNTSLEPITVFNVDRQGNSLPGACFSSLYGQVCDEDDGANDGRMTVFAHPGPFDLWMSGYVAEYEPVAQPMRISVVTGGPNEVRFANNRSSSGVVLTTLIIHLVDEDGDPLSDNLTGACFVVWKGMKLGCDADDGFRDGTISMVAKTGDAVLIEIRAPLGNVATYSGTVTLTPNPTNEITIANARPTTDEPTPTASPGGSSTPSPTSSATTSATQTQGEAAASGTATSIVDSLPNTGSEPAEQTTGALGPLLFGAAGLFVLSAVAWHRRQSAFRR
jgi:uncharacterized surface anchored protein